MYKIATVCVSGATAVAIDPKPIPRGITGAVVELRYDDSIWAGLRKKVAFRGSAETEDLCDENTVTFPAEVAEKKNTRVTVGITGVSEDGTVIIPTLWADLGSVRDSAYGNYPAPGEPAPPVWAQLLTMIGDLKNLDTEAKDNLVNAVNEAMTKGGSGGLTVYTLAEGESIDDAPADADIIHDPYNEPEASGGGLVVYTLSEGETVDDAPADADIIHDPYEEPEIPEADISLNVEGASVGQIVKVAAVDEAGKPTAWEAVEMPSGGNEWVKLGDSTVHDTYEFIPTSFTGGVVTIDPNSEGYEYIIGRSATICVVHPINIALKEAAVVGILKLKDANAGTFDFYDRDNNPKTNAAYDPAKYKISVLNVASIAFQNVENYQRYKLRVTSPVISTNGLRPFFASSMTGLSLGACVNVLKTGGVIIEREFYQFPGDENYMYVRTCISYGAFYGGISTNEMQSIEIIATGEGKTKPPLNKEVSFTASNMIFVNGTRFELWGANDA